MIKNFIDINNFKKLELRNILQFAKKIKNQPSKYNSLFKNKSVGLIFEKQSARTRLSFTIGIHKFGGNVVEIDSKKIGFNNRESKKDILMTLSQYLDCIMIRNDNHKQLIELSNYNILPIINGLSNFSHPCQILSDIFTIEENLGKIEDNVITWIGDINNVLISLIHAAEIFQFRLNVITPKKIMDKQQKLINKNKLKYAYFFNDIEEGIINSNCIMTDTWVSMGEKNIKNKKNILRKYQINESVMKKAKNNAIFMHCLPAHRNEEVVDAVIDGNKSVVWQQAKNRMYVQQSIINYLLKTKR